MPSTRSRGAAGATAVSDGNFPTVEPEGEGSADPQLATEQGNMSAPKDLMDSEIVRLRASVTASRKLLDDLNSEIVEQVQIVNDAAGRNGPRAVLVRYTKVLESLFNDGDKLLNTFTESNNDLLLRLEMLLLRLEAANPDEYKRVEGVRNHLVGQAVPYKGMFRKLRVKHEGLLAILLEGEQSVTGSSVAAPAIAIPHSRKEYSFLKPTTINEDCSKRELTKFIKDARIWLNKTLTEDEKQEPGMVLAVIRSVLDSGWTE